VYALARIAALPAVASGCLRNCAAGTDSQISDRHRIATRCEQNRDPEGRAGFDINVHRIASAGDDHPQVGQLVEHLGCDNIHFGDEDLSAVERSNQIVPSQDFSGFPDAGVFRVHDHAQLRKRARVKASRNQRAHLGQCARVMTRQARQSILQARTDLIVHLRRHASCACRADRGPVFIAFLGSIPMSRIAGQWRMIPDKRSDRACHVLECAGGYACT
jgi:hypothetical protein